ncbi:MAG: shikimate dehydrogenase [Lachnospiraceae bacterium]|nr:shikimate dehydrogenase [Lachnospiraceae bacterium]
MNYGLIAEHLSHSFSKEIHEKFGLYEYELCELAPEELESFMRKKDFRGINVTIPYKEQVIPYLDYVDPAAARIGAVNTIVNKNGKLRGYNTDYYGMKALLNKHKMSLRDKHVLILGTGGTSKTAYQVAKDLGASKITKVSRKESPEAVSYVTASKMDDTEFIINTTPVGMYPNMDASPMDISCFHNLEGVVDCIYNPYNTDLVLQAREMGVKATGGLYMLVMQAVKAAKIFTGTDIDREKIKSVYLEIKLQKSTISFIGMPAVGKTTFGKLSAEKFGLKFVDTDDYIEEKAGMTIPEIFEKYGEDHFRKLETEAIMEVSKCPGSIIATGGGCVKKPENMAVLRRTGTVIFLNRDSKNIKPSAGRPLSDSAEKLAKLYEERMPLYRKYSEFAIELKGRPVENLSKIRRIINVY